MNKIYYLSTCSTCSRIINDLSLKGKKFIFQDIKTEKITPEQLDELKEMAGSYEALFSRRSMKYKALGLGDKQLTEKDYRRYILDEYTFLKRPVIVVGTHTFVGNAKATVEAAKKAIAE